MMNTICRLKTKHTSDSSKQIFTNPNDTGNRLHAHTRFKKIKNELGSKCLSGIWAPLQGRPVKVACMS